MSATDPEKDSSSSSKHLSYISVLKAFFSGIVRKRGGKKIHEGSRAGVGRKLIKATGNKGKTKEVCLSKIQ